MVNYRSLTLHYGSIWSIAFVYSMWAFSGKIHLENLLFGLVLWDVMFEHGISYMCTESQSYLNSFEFNLHYFHIISSGMSLFIFPFLILCPCTLFNLLFLLFPNASLSGWVYCFIFLYIYFFYYFFLFIYTSKPNYVPLMTLFVLVGNS